MCKNLSMKSPVLLFCNFGTGPSGTRDGKILPDLGTQRRLGTACSSALARWALDLIQGGIYSPADTLFSTCFGHGTQQCPNFRDWNRLKSSSSWYGSKNEDHWVGDLSPEQLWGGGKYSAGQERRLKNGWICFFYCELYVSLSFSIILYLTCKIEIQIFDLIPWLVVSTGGQVLLMLQLRLNCGKHPHESGYEPGKYG